MHLFDFFFLLFFICSTETNNELDEELFDLDEEFMLLDIHKKDPFPRFVTTMMMSYILSENIQIRDLHTKIISNAYERLCDIFISATPRNYKCRIESLFWETFDKIYLKKNGIFYEHLKARFDSIYKNLKNTKTLRICHLFSSTLSESLSDSTKYKISKYTAEKMNTIYYINIKIADNIISCDNKNSNRIMMHIEYTTNLLEEKLSCTLFTKEKKISHVSEINHTLIKGLAKSEILKIESDINQLFVSNVILMICEYKKNGVLINCKEIVDQIYDGVKFFITSRFLQLKKYGKYILASEMGVELLKKPIKYCEINCEKEILILTRILKLYSVIDKNEVNEILDMINDIKHLMKFVHFYSIFDYFTENTKFEEFLYAITSLKIDNFRKAIKVIKEKNILSECFSKVLKSLAKQLHMFVKTSIN